MKKLKGRKIQPHQHSQVLGLNSQWMGLHFWNDADNRTTAQFLFSG